MSSCDTWPCVLKTNGLLSVPLLLLGGWSRDLFACPVKKLELGFRLGMTLQTRTCPTMVSKHFLIPTERPINKADKSGAAQIELLGEPRVSTWLSSKILRSLGEAWWNLEGCEKHSWKTAVLPMIIAGNLTLSFILICSFFGAEFWPVDHRR